MKVKAKRNFSAGREKGKLVIYQLDKEYSVEDKKAKSYIASGWMEKVEK